MTKKIKITTEYITLGQLLKFSSIASYGTEAKVIIESGAVKVNGAAALQRGKKLRPGDKISVSFNADFEELEVE